MTSNGSSRTPFDNDLVNDPDAPRHTQPLPPSKLGSALPTDPPSRAPDASSQNDTQPLPSRPVAPQPVASQPVAPSAPTSWTPPNAAVPNTVPPAWTQPNPAPPSWTQTAAVQPTQAAPANGSGLLGGPRTARLKDVPMVTLVGLAAAGGALAVILLSLAVRRVVKTEPLQGDPHLAATPRPIATPIGNEAVSQPVPVTPRATPKVIITTPDDSSSTPAPSPSAQSGSSPDAPPPDVDSPDDNGGASSSDDNSNTNNSSEDSGASGDGSGSSQTVSDTSGGRFVHRSSGYSIAPPAGFRRSKSGRRTVWKGPQNASILVETMSTPGSTPRRDWERLDTALAKKYGAGYVSHGITETTLAGQPAAAWEFEITSKHGTTHKIDVAVHDKGTGYAVLVSAPAANFESLRPQLEEALRSFQLPAPGFHARRSRTSHRSRPAVQPSAQPTPDAPSGY